MKGQSVKVPAGISGVTIAAVASMLVLLAMPSVAAAQTDQGAPFQIKTSGFGNAAGAVADRGAGISGEAEIETTPQFRTASGTVLAVRAVGNVNGSASGPQSRWNLSVPEASVFAIGSFGRIEVGARAGFPQSLVGFTPSEIAFASPAFGPESGARLDPDGRLPTRFLPAGIASRIDALTYLGYAARFYDDRSFKFIYLTPRSKGGFYAAFSFTPKTSQPRGFGLAGSSRATRPVLEPSGRPSSRRNLVQGALVWTHRTEAIDLSVGATYSHAGAAGPLEGSTSSLSGGAALTVRDTWTLGISATRDDFLKAAHGPFRQAPFGVVVSTDLVRGRWIVGGYYQHATADARTTLPQRDAVDIGEVGVSYLLDADHDLLGERYHTEAKLFASLYHYALRSEGYLPTQSRGQAFVAGARFSFY